MIYQKLFNYIILIIIITKILYTYHINSILVKYDERF